MRSRIRRSHSLIILATLALLASASRANAQDRAAGSLPGENANDVTPPSLKDHPSPAYPEEALRLRVEGTVGLELQIDDAGKVTDVRVTQPAGHGFDEAARAAVKSWTFTPATRAGRPIASSLQLAFPFQLPGAKPVDAVPPTPPPTPPGSDIQTQRGADQTTIVIAARSPAPPRAASDSRTTQEELSLRPRFRLENTLEAVPGLFSVQHSGGGKAQQYFLRGFDADHGTDIAFAIDGAPINMPSHGHGQGFSDLHFIIPETIGELDSTKGPYSARAGDFATAGSVNFQMADHIAESYAKVEVGPNSHTRLVALESPDLGPDWRMLAAAEVFHDDGPFIHPDDFQRFNGYFKVSHALDDRSDVSLMLTAYGGSWNASGVLPARAVCGEGDGTPTPANYAGSRCLSRWDSVDPTQGGDTQRYEAVSTYRRRFNEHTDAEATFYAVRYSFQLFPNDGIAAPFQPAGEQYGSQVEQDDARTVIGTNMRVTNKTQIAGIDVRSTLGIQLRDDSIHSELHRTEQRQRLDGKDPLIPGPITDSNIDESNIAFYAEEEFHPAHWLHFVLGARGDRIDVALDNASDVAVNKWSGVKGQAQFSPKATMVVSPAKWLDFFANYGRGYHSNDARTIFNGQATTLMAAATGYEVGTSVHPVKGLTVNAVGFLLDLQSELTIDGDDATTSVAGPTRRYGLELTGRYNFNNVVYADAAFTATHARYTDQSDINSGQALVALAPIRTFFAGIGAKYPIGPVTLFGSVHVKSMSDRPATQDGTLTATGFTLVDGQLGARWNRYELGADVLNIGDANWREGQFAVQSRLPGEGAVAPPVGMSFTPGIPRTALAHASVYW